LGDVHVDLGLTLDPRTEYDTKGAESWLGTASRWLDRLSLDYDYADTHAGCERLNRYDTIFLQSTGFLAADAQQRLGDWVEQGGRLLIGPGLPTLDPNLDPCALLAAGVKAPGVTAIGKGELIWTATDELRETIERI